MHVNKCDVNKCDDTLLQITQTLASSTTRSALETVFLRDRYSPRSPFSLAWRRLLTMSATSGGEFVAVGRSPCRASLALQILIDRGTTPSCPRLPARLRPPTLGTCGGAFPRSARPVAYGCQIPGHETADVLILFLSGAPPPTTGAPQWSVSN